MNFAHTNSHRFHIGAEHCVGFGTYKIVNVHFFGLCRHHRKYRTAQNNNSNSHDVTPYFSQS